MKVEVIETLSAYVVGDVIEIDGDTIPPSMVNKVRPVERGKTAVTNPAKGAIPSGYEAKHRSRGSFSVMLGDDEVMEGLSKADAEAFNAMSAAKKAEYVKAGE